MKIAFLSSLNPNDQNIWSGTLYRIYSSLKKRNEVIWIGMKTWIDVINFHKKNYGEQIKFVPEQYAQIFGILLSKQLKKDLFDVIICRDYFFTAYLVTDIPIVYFGDTTFNLFNQYMEYKDKKFIQLANELDRRVINKARRLVYSSKWARKSAIEDYGASTEKIRIIEFGANIDIHPQKIERQVNGNICNLIFIGKRWEKKGGKKALKTFWLLKKRGFKCTLTIIGSKPSEIVNDSDIHIFPFIDKSTEEGRILYDKLLSQSHFLILPTQFDCFGIVFCEASAYGIPSLATNIGGVSQPIKEGVNGYLFAPKASAKEYADKIQQLFENKPLYNRLSMTSRKEFENRLNWDIWEKKMNTVLEDIVTKDNEEEFYIPVYAINLKERENRKSHILKEFKGRDEFELTIIDACTHSIKDVGLWNSIIKIIHMAQENDNDVIIICKNNHFFTKHYSKKILFKNIIEAYSQEADILSGGIGGFGQAVPVASNRYWVDWFVCTQFLVIYKKFYNVILDYSFQESDTVDEVISLLSSNKMVIYPFISEQKDCGCSEVAQMDMENKRRINELFDNSNYRMKMIHHIVNKFKNYD